MSLFLDCKAAALKRTASPDLLGSRCSWRKNLSFRNEFDSLFSFKAPANKDKIEKSQGSLQDDKDFSHEAPARLFSPTSKTHIRRRASSLWESPDRDDGFVKLESIPQIENTNLHFLVALADSALKSGLDPIAAEGGLGGAYFLRDRSRSIVVVCKPGDEEPNSHNNRHRSPSSVSPRAVNGSLMAWGASYKGRIMPGFGMFREVAAYVLDDGFAGVPPTQLGKIRHRIFGSDGDKPLTASSGSATFPLTNGVVDGGQFNAYKSCSLQSYVRHESSAEDVGPSRFNIDDVLRIAVFDLLLCNLDRHEGNILVCRSSPYQGSPSRRRRVVEMEIDLIEKQVSSSAPAAAQNFESFAREHRLGSRSGASRTPSPFSRDTDGIDLYRLVPIDHGYILPHVFSIGEANFAWLHWPQLKFPIPAGIKEYIASLSFDSHVHKLRQCVGAAIEDTSLLTLYVCMAMLKTAVAADLNLFDVACAYNCTPFSPCATAHSPLQSAVHNAVRMTVAQIYCAVHAFDASALSPAAAVTTHIAPPVPALFLHPSRSATSAGACAFPFAISHGGLSFGSVVNKSSLLEPPRSLVQSVPINDAALKYAMNFEGGRWLASNIENAVRVLVSVLKTDSHGA